MLWRDVGNEVFNLYFRIYDKHIDHEAAQDAVVELIEEAMASSGLEPEHPWSASLTTEATSELIMAIGKRLQSCEEDLGRSVADQFLWPLHSWLSEALNYAVEAKGSDEFSELEVFINTDLRCFLESRQQ